MCKCITMDKPMCSNVIKEVLLRLIRIDYPSVEEIKVTYSFVSEHSSYHVYVGVSYTDLIWEHSYSFIEYVDNYAYFENIENISPFYKFSKKERKSVGGVYWKFFKMKKYEIEKRITNLFIQQITGEENFIYLKN